MIVFIAGHIFLAEPFERRETLAAFASLVGVLLITRPSSLFGGEEQVMMRHAGGGRAGGTGPGLVGGSHNAAIAVSMLGVAGAAAACESHRGINRDRAGEQVLE